MRDYREAILSAKEICDSFKEGQSDPRDYYRKLFSALRSKDKEIARRYNDITGSRYLLKLGGLLAEGVLSHNDIQNLDEEIKFKLTPFL